MNTVSLNNLWSYLQGLRLTASNKKWLADHLYESARIEERPMTREEKIAEAARFPVYEPEEFLSLMTN